MSRGTLLRFGAIFAALLTAAVILFADYYESPEGLVMQIALIAGPSFLPFSALASGKDPPRWMLAVVTAVIAAGWALVVYEDTRPYTGGGASMAVLFGWMTCIVAVLLALLLVGVNGAIRRRRGDDPPR